MTSRVAYIWDYDIAEEKFKDILSGKLAIGKLDQEWAHGHVKVADDVAKAVIAGSRGIDLSDAHEGMASFHGFQDCFAIYGRTCFVIGQERLSVAPMEGFKCR